MVQNIAAKILKHTFTIHCSTLVLRIVLIHTLYLCCYFFQQGEVDDA